MSAFDHIASAAAVEETKARGAVARLFSRVPAPGAAVTVNVGRRSFLGTLAKGAAVAALCAVAYWQGGSGERARFEAYRADEAVTATNEMNRQAAARAAIQADADRRVNDAKADAARSKEDVDAYLAELAHRPVTDRCSLSDADLRGLRALRSGGAARSHRRPTRPLADAD